MTCLAPGVIQGGQAAKLNEVLGGRWGGLRTDDALKEKGLRLFPRQGVNTTQLKGGQPSFELQLRYQPQPGRSLEAPLVLEGHQLLGEVELTHPGIGPWLDLAIDFEGEFAPVVVRRL